MIDDAANDRGEISRRDTLRQRAMCVRDYVRDGKKTANIETQFCQNEL